MDLSQTLPVTTLFSKKSYFSLRTSYKYLLWCTNDQNVHIHTFHKSWSFIWGWFFLWVSLTEFLYLRTEQSQHIVINLWCVKWFIFWDFSDEYSAFKSHRNVLLIYEASLNFPLNDFLQSKIMPKLSSLQKITHIIVIVDKKNNCSLSICIYYVPSAFLIK